MIVWCVTGIMPKLMCIDMQVGNSGMFRPEMLRPMGLPEDVNVIAWGLGLERYAAPACTCDLGDLARLKSHCK